MTDELTCISCKKKVTNSSGTVVFHCPKCKENIIRCGHCRKLAASYNCKCGFNGPN